MRTPYIYAKLAKSLPAKARPDDFKYSARYFRISKREYPIIIKELKGLGLLDIRGRKLIRRS